MRRKKKKVLSFLMALSVFMTGSGIGGASAAIAPDDNTAPEQYTVTLPVYEACEYRYETSHKRENPGADQEIILQYEPGTQVSFDVAPGDGWSIDKMQLFGNKSEIPLMIANALADKPLPVYGEGLNIRDWLYVEDHCKAIDLIIHNGRVGEVYNVGGHNEKQNIEIVKIICKELGKPESLITHVGDRKGHDMRYAIDPTKIHSELGWLPETKFEDGIKKTIKWYLENREWWETIISGEYQNYYEKMYSNR